MEITELIKKHPELKINPNSTLIEDPTAGILYIKTENKLQQLTVENGNFSLKQITEVEDPSDLRRVRDLTDPVNQGD